MVKNTVSLALKSGVFMYQVLARKYRPRNFNELVGQNHVSRALTSALDRGRLHHAYLFTGTRGVGKTTIARILAKCLNCETGVTSTPCEVCATCKAVNEGRFIDLIEIDAASRTKVEDTRELLDNVPYAPTQGRFKVYLIDEVHMLSTHSFNALLKTLEEPPEHVKFLFATTDPQKLPITVISRCLQFTLRPLVIDEITHHLTDILGKEEIESESDAIWQIAESAQGSLRDALSLTDQAIAYGQGAVHHQDVKEMLGLIDRTIIYDLILAIHQNQRERMSHLLRQFRQQALDVSLVLDQLISTLHELALMQYLPDLSLKYSAEINQKITQLAQVVSAQDLQLYYQIACKGRADLQIAVTQEQGFEMTVLRLLAFRPLQANEITVNTNQSVQTLQTQAIEQNHSQANPQHVEQRNQSSTIIEETLETQNTHHVDEAINQPLDEVVSLQQTETVDSVEVQTHTVDGIVENVDIQTTVETSNVKLESVAQQNQLSKASISIQEEPDLTLFGGEHISTIAPQNVQSTVDAEDIFFLAPETEQIVKNINIEPELSKVTTAVFTQSEMGQSKVVAEQSHEPIVASSSTTAAQLTGSTQTPQQILQLIPQNLEGEWDVHKWEYWFRNSQLSPAVQELAQNGVMTGHINGQSTFSIPQQYENLLVQFQHTLENALNEQWSQTRLSFAYRESQEITPFELQNERKIKAFNRAAEMLQDESVVKNLMNAFNGEIQNIQLKP